MHNNPRMLNFSIANDQGNRTTPSYVAFAGDERLIGDAAKNQAAANPSNTVFDAKRLIGQKFSDSNVQSDMKHFTYKVIDNVIELFDKVLNKTLHFEIKDYYDKDNPKNMI
jgi:molecular chaperone DnaK (HSP70)